MYMQEWSHRKPSGMAKENRAFALVVSEDSVKNVGNEARGEVRSTNRTLCSAMGQLGTTLSRGVS